MPRVSSDDIERFVDEYLTFGEGNCVQAAIYGGEFSGRQIVPSRRNYPIGGWFTDGGELAIEMGRVGDVSAYVTINPVSRMHRPAGHRNTMRFLKKGQTAGDSDITTVRYVRIDIDPPGKLVPSASTDAELAGCVEIRDRIEAERGLGPHALPGISGNGAFLLVRLPDLPNDKSCRDKVASFIASFAGYRGEHGCHVDTQLSISAPCRTIPIPGMMKCKGDYSTPERPWRPTTIEFRDITPFDLDGWISENGLLVPPRRVPKNAPRGSVRENYDQAREWMFSGKAGAAIDGEHGHERCIKVAVALVKGFDLCQGDALSLLSEWNRGNQPPFSDADLRHKIADADLESGPRGEMVKPPRPVLMDHLRFEEGDRGARPPGPPPPPPDDGNGGDGDEDAYRDGPPDDPVKLAIMFRDENMAMPGYCYYRYHLEQWWRWNGSHYAVIPDKAFASTLLLYMKRKVAAHNAIIMQLPPEERRNIRPLRVTKAALDLMTVALRRFVAIEDAPDSESFWIGRPPFRWEPENIVPFDNRLMDMQAFTNGDRNCWSAKTPQLFNTYSLSYRFPYDHYDGPVPMSPSLDYYLNSSLDGDPDGIMLAQEMIAYLITPSNKYQKLFMIIGYPRTGKGTMLRIIENLIGIKNIAYPRFSTLAAVPFGCQQLIGKRVAIMPDAKLSGRTDITSATEVILAITGDDPQTVPQKYLSDATLRLACRFVITANEVPWLRDNAGGFFKRAIILQFNKSFMGREDVTLSNKLKAETPQIMRWAMDGWLRLEQRGHFIQPASGQGRLDELMRLTSPILHFTEDMIDVLPEYSEDIGACYASFRDWSMRMGRESIPDRVIFERDITSAIPGVTSHDRRFLGLRMKSGAVLSHIQFTNGHHPDINELIGINSN